MSVYTIQYNSASWPMDFFRHTLILNSPFAAFYPYFQLGFDAPLSNLFQRNSFDKIDKILEAGLQ